jgi:hypothetical protein
MAPLPTVGKTAQPTDRSKKRERPGSVFPKRAMVSCASFTSSARAARGRAMKARSGTRRDRFTAEA